MGKRIGLLVQDLDSEYMEYITDGAQRYCRENGHQLFVYIIRAVNWTAGSFDHGNYAALSLATKDNLDGILLVTNIYTQFAPKSRRQSLVEELSYLPLVSIGAPVQGFSSVVSRSKKAFKEMLEHLYSKHGCRRFTMMLPHTTSEDIIRRKEAFLEFLEEKKIDFESSMIIHADYSFYKARQALKKHHISKNKLPFDALVCANDDLAFGSISYLDEMGIRVPEDVKVTGFDNQKRCEHSEPRLLTVDQKIEEQGYVAARLLMDKIKDPSGPVENAVIDAVTVYRESCGCSMGKRNSVYTENERFFFRQKDYLSTFQFFLQEMQSYLSLDEFRSMLVKHLRDFEIESCVMCLYDEPIYYDRNKKFELPETASVLIAYNGDSIYNFDGPKIVNPENCPMPEGFNFKKGEAVLVSSLFNNSFQYGYAMYTPGKVTSKIYELVFSVVGTVLASNRILYLKDEETKILIKKNENLEYISTTDSLTGVLNRTGIMKYGQSEIERSLSMKITGGVIYGDMDHLKQINDDFGHDTGDLAIQAEAGILKKVFRKTDIIGRLGGDEFVVIASGLDEVNFLKVKEKINQYTSEYNSTSGNPFEISISLGYVPFTKEMPDLGVLLKEADQKQYEEKRLHHKARK